MRYFYFIIVIFLTLDLSAQNFPSSTSATSRIESAKTKLTKAKSSIYSNILAKNIGPTIMSGRVVDLDVNPKAPHEFYVAYASGGLWKTINNGASFVPLFEQEMVMTIGDIAVNWETGEIWLGSGEVNSSRSSYSGVGIFYSSDWGESWTHKGLDDTHHIGRVIIDKDNSEKLYVAALGHLYSQNEERGVFVSLDKGNTWEKTLFISNKTGVVDLIQDPRNANILYAAAWERDRKAWDFVESGTESGIYKSIDGGETWSLNSDGTNGFPSTSGTGRIGLSTSYSLDGKPVVYALLDNYDRQDKTDDIKDGLQKDDFKTMSKEAFAKIEDDILSEFLKENGFPEKYTSTSVKEMVSSGKIMAKDIASYLEDANRLLFDTPVIGASLYRSDDEGKSWTITHTDMLPRVYNSYGYYFGVVEAAPGNPETVYIAGVPLLRSDDGGKMFENIGRENVHADHHAIWINPANINHIVNGNDGGVNISYDSGANYFKCNSPTVGQFYAINVDNAEPYNVYGGLQDNGVWFGSNNYDQNVSWHSRGNYPYQSIMGGDGMQIAIDTRDNKTVYTGYQFGNYFRINTETRDRQYITPKHELGDSPYRWNWQTPVMLSSHNQDIFYMGSNKLLRSMNQGEDFVAISPDLTSGGRKGDVAYGTLTSISESELSFGLIYTGSDDGMVYRTKDGGASWNKIMKDLPNEFWVSRIITSTHEKGTVYLSLNGYRWDNFESMIYRSTDYGDNWTAIGKELPLEPVNVIKEDPHFEEIIYVGTDHGTYISHDYGKKFSLLSADIPKVAVHDLVIHKRDKDLLIGTHGRSIYKVDLAPIYDQRKAPNAKLVAQNVIKGRASSNWGNKNWRGFFSKSDRQVYIYSENAGNLSIELQTKDGNTLKRFNQEIDAGYTYLTVDFTIEQRNAAILKNFIDKTSQIEKREDGNMYIESGEYKYVFTINGESATTKITLK